MTLIVNVLHQLLHTAHIVGFDAAAVFKVVIHGNHRDAGADKFLHRSGCVVRHQHRHAIAVAVAHMGDEVAAPGAALVADEGDIIAQLLGAALEAVENVGEVLVGQAAVGAVVKDHADVVGMAGLQVAGGGAGDIAHLVRHLLNPGGGLRADIGGTVQRLADGGHGNAAGLCQHF